MTAWECLRSAIRALRANLLRSALTMLGIVVGVAAVIAMVAIGIPAVLIADGSLELPTAKLGIGVLVAVLMAVGSVAYALALRSLPAGPTAAIATSYVVIVVVLSAVFLHERTDWVTVVGVALTLSGVGVLSLRG